MMNANVHGERTRRTGELIKLLLAVVAELEEMHPGRSFPLDGHLVGSIGEAAAEAMFAIKLQPASTPGHDALTDDGRPVEIKATFGRSGVGLRATSAGHDGIALIVLRLSKTSEELHEVIFNGPLALVLNAAGATQSNGQAHLGLARLRQLDSAVPDCERVPAR